MFLYLKIGVFLASSNLGRWIRWICKLPQSCLEGREIRVSLQVAQGKVGP